MTQDFHLSLKRTARRPKPNPLLQMVLLAGDKADLRALVAFGLGPSPSAELALGAWAEAKAFLQAQVGRLPKALAATFRGVLF